jgi:tryptophan 2,3-dioxygenase
MTDQARAGYYASYLELNPLLSLQKPLTSAEGRSPAHDEMLFIIVHQAYELWFKQVLHELGWVIKEMSPHKTIRDEAETMSTIVRRLKRIVEIWKLLNQQVDVLETMTPLDFLDFRGEFDGASGFQSRQFREIEARLGLKMENRFGPGGCPGHYYKRIDKGGFNPEDHQAITDAETQTTLMNCLKAWLERMPWLDQKKYWDGEDGRSDHPFWKTYRKNYKETLNPSEVEKRLEGFDIALHADGIGELSPCALRSVLFIMLYRDLPVLRLPFELLTALQEIDEHIGNFRYRHLQMVRRTIGLRQGTGGTSGAGYLEGSLNQNYIFKDVSQVVTYLVGRNKRPDLPERLKLSLIVGW